jgi:hypothetical protein
MADTDSSRRFLKGCNAEFINGLVSRHIRGGDINNIKAAMKAKTMEIVSSYDIADCMKVITQHGDFHDAYVKLQASGVPIDVSNKLKFHRQVALIYVKNYIKTRFNTKVEAHRLKSSGCVILRGDTTCSICLETITSDAHTTPCRHNFHRACMRQWGRNNCPMCRADF